MSTVGAAPGPRCQDAPLNPLMIADGHCDVGNAVRPRSASLLNREHDTPLSVSKLAELEHGEPGSVAVEELSHSVEQCGPLATAEDRHARPVCMEHGNVSPPHEAMRRSRIQLTASHVPRDASTAIGPYPFVDRLGHSSAA
jgi:hypothetical protein